MLLHIRHCMPVWMSVERICKEWLCSMQQLCDRMRCVCVARTETRTFEIVDQVFLSIGEAGSRK
jgi:hypothetical protein